MKKIIVLVYLLLPVFLIAQQDPEAKKILDSFSKKTKSYNAYSADFSIESENTQNGENSINKGSILLMGDKYRVTLDQVVMYFDGKNIFNYTPKAKEVSIAKPLKNEDELLLKNPSKLFNLYAKDYKYRLIGELNYKGKNCYEIDLYPNDFKTKFSIVKLLIDKEKLELVAAKLKMKSGVNYTLELKNFNSKAVASDTDFTFDPAKHKGVEVIDLR